LSRHARRASRARSPFGLAQPDPRSAAGALDLSRHVICSCLGMLAEPHEHSVRLDQPSRIQTQPRALRIENGIERAVALSKKYIYYSRKKSTLEGSFGQQGI